MNSITILFFASFRDITGKRSISIEIPNDFKIAQLKNLLIEDYPGLEKYMHAMILALNHEFADNNTLIPTGAEIAIFPPVSGGKK